MAAEPPNEVCVVWELEMSVRLRQGWVFLGRYPHPVEGAPQEDFVRWLEMRDYVWLVR